MEENICWCPNCDVPLLSKKCFKCGTKDVFYCSSDFKPVFKQEKSIFEEVTKTDLPSNLFRCKNRIISSGKTLFRYGISNGQLITLESNEKIKEKLNAIDNFDEEKLHLLGRVTIVKIKKIKNNREIKYWRIVQ